MSSDFEFKIEKKLSEKLGRAGVIKTSNGEIKTPAFVVVGTQATVKALSPEQVRDTGAEVVLANTYHLHLEPGSERVKEAGGLHKFMNWRGPTMTDSGGFQALSLGFAYESGGGKIGLTENLEIIDANEAEKNTLAKITEEGITFKSHRDGSKHLFTPERSVEIQHNIGADMIFAFDEATSYNAPYEYQKKSMERTHAWAKRSLDAHKKLGGKQALFGIVQGGKFEDLRKESAKVIGGMNFDGFGIGGSYDKEAVATAVKWVNEILPEEKPRHLLGIGEPADLFGAVENGCDLFDCVAPTRMGRNGAIYTKNGRINILNAKFKEDFSPIEEGCECYACKNYTRAYLSHLFRAEEMFGATHASIHNVYFIVNMVKKMREAIFDGSFEKYKKDFLKSYYKK